MRLLPGGEGSGREEVGNIVQGVGGCHNRALLIWSDKGRQYGVAAVFVI